MGSSALIVLSSEPVCCLCGSLNAILCNNNKKKASLVFAQAVKKLKTLLDRDHQA